MANVNAFGKVVKPAGVEPSELEKDISSALLDIKTAKEEGCALLEQLYFIGAQEHYLGDKRCIVIEVPVPQLRDFQKIHQKIVRELEKKFSGAHVVIVAKRRMLQKPVRGKHHKPLKQKRPRSRTLTAVHDAILQDLVYPAEVVGRRTRVKLDGKLLHKVHLDKAQLTTVEHKVDTFVNMYKRMTGRDVAFEFPDMLV